MKLSKIIKAAGFKSLDKYCNIVDTNRVTLALMLLNRPIRFFHLLNSATISLNKGSVNYKSIYFMSKNSELFNERKNGKCVISDDYIFDILEEKTIERYVGDGSIYIFNDNSCIHIENYYVRSYISVCEFLKSVSNQ